MTDYAKSTNFAVKDTLTSGDPNKIVSGAEIDAEFSNIASSSTTKIDKVSTANADNLASFTATGAVKDSGFSASSFAPATAILPSGCVVPFAGDTAPSGWIECDGRAISRTANSDLFDIIGVTYGNGNGSTTFNVPDLRGEFVRGWDNGRGIDAGRSLGSNQGDAIRNITGRMNSVETREYTASGAISLAGGSESSAGGGSSATRDLIFDASTQVPTASENRPRNVAMMYIIKT